MANTTYRNYKIDFNQQVIYFDYKFARLAQVYQSQEYNLYRDLCRDFPTFKVSVQSHRKPSKTARPRLTYKAMIAYINSYNEADKLMEEFETVKAKYNGKYSCVREWFIDRFPDYGNVYAQNYVITNKVIGKGSEYIEFTPAAMATPENGVIIDAVVVDENGEVIE